MWVMEREMLAWILRRDDMRLKKSCASLGKKFLLHNIQWPQKNVHFKNVRKKFTGKSVYTEAL